MRIISFSIFLFLLIFSSMNANTSDDLIIRGADSLEYYNFDNYVKYEMEIESSNDSIKYLVFNNYEKDVNYYCQFPFYYIQHNIKNQIIENEKRLDTIFLDKNNKVHISFYFKLGIVYNLKETFFNFIDNNGRTHRKKTTLYQPFWMPVYNFKDRLDYSYNCKNERNKIDFELYNNSDYFDYQVSNFKFINLLPNEYDLYYIEEGFFKNKKIKLNLNDIITISPNSTLKISIELILKEAKNDYLEFDILHNSKTIITEKTYLRNIDDINISWKDYNKEYVIDFSKNCLDSINVNIPTAAMGSSFSFYTDDDHEVEIKDGITTDGETYVTFYRNKPGTYMLCFSSCYFKEDLFFIVKNDD